MKRPTIKDLAEASGVSTATVDRVLNDRHSVRTATALRVLQAAQKLGFHAVPLLQQRIGGEKPTIVFGLILPHVEQEFYSHFRAIAEQVASGFLHARIQLVVEYLPRISPDEIAASLRAVAGKAQAIGLVSIDHPRVTEEVQRLRDKGVPVFALLSDFAQGVRESYIGTNNLKVGRTAAWMLARGIAEKERPVDVAIFVGGHRWHGHDLRETGFRAWFRQNRPNIVVLDTQVNLDTVDLAYEATSSLISRYPGLAGIYCAGGGREGIIRAIRDEGYIARTAIIANEFTDITRSAMADGIVDLVIDTPVREIVTTAYQSAVAVLADGLGHSVGQQFLQTNLMLPESF